MSKVSAGIAAEILLEQMPPLKNSPVVMRDLLYILWIVTKGNVCFNQLSQALISSAHDSLLYEQLGNRPRQHFLQNFKLNTFEPIASTVSSKKQTFRRRAKKPRFRTPRMTPEPLDRPLTLVDKQNGISTFSFSKSTDRVPLTSKYIHVYNSSSWVQNWKQNSKSRRFGKVMIKTSFTLFSIKKTPSYDENHENSMRGTDDQIYYTISARAPISAVVASRNSCKR